MAGRTKVMLGFAAVYVIWGSTYLAIATSVRDIPPVFMVAVRGMIAGGALYAWVRFKGAAPVQWREIVAMIPTAILLFGGGYVLVGWAELRLPSGPTALLNSTTPLWVVLFEWYTGKRARPSLRFIVSVALGVIGVAVLVGGRGASALPVLPAVACVCSSIAWGAGMLRTRSHAHGDPRRDAAIQLLTGGLLLLPLSIGLGEMPQVLDGFDNKSLLALGYLITIGSLVAYSAYVFLLHNVTASKVSSTSYVNPLIAVILGAALASEKLYVNTLIAALLILFSVYFVVSERREAGQRESVPRSVRPRIAA